MSPSTRVSKSPTKTDVRSDCSALGTGILYGATNALVGHPMDTIKAKLLMAIVPDSLQLLFDQNQAEHVLVKSPLTHAPGKNASAGWKLVNEDSLKQRLQSRH